MIRLKLEIDIAVVDLNPRIDRGDLEVLMRRGDQRQQIGEMDGPAGAFDWPKLRREIEPLGAEIAAAGHAPVIPVDLTFARDRALGQRDHTLCQPGQGFGLEPAVKGDPGHVEIGMAARGVEIVADQRLNHRAVALGLTQQGLRGEGGRMQLQRRIARHQRIEPGIKLAVLDRQAGPRDRQITPGKAPLPGRIEHIERHGIKLELGPGESPGDDFAEHGIKLRDFERGGLVQRPRRCVNIARRQIAGPGQADRPGAQANRGRAQRTG